MVRWALVRTWNASAGLPLLLPTPAESSPLVLSYVPRPLQEGEGFRAACGSRNHALMLVVFRAHQQLKRKRGPAWLLAQAWLLLGLLALFIFRRTSYLATAFATGYSRARRRGAAPSDSGSGRADSGSGGGGSGRRKK